MSRHWWMTPLAFLLLGSLAQAQDFGRRWLDRIRTEIVEEPPVRTQATILKWTVGELVYHDDNVFLESAGEDDDTVFVTFADVRLEHTTPEVDVVLDFQANYIEYSDLEDFSDDEARLFGWFRYLGRRITIELIEIARRESDPVDIVLLERAERNVTNTIPRIGIFLTETVHLSLEANVQSIEFDDPIFSALDNRNSRYLLSLNLIAPDDFRYFLDFGWIDIEYDDAPSPSNADGVFYRIGFSGWMSQTVLFRIRAGYTEIEAESTLAEDSTADIDLLLRYEVSQTTTVTLEYTRRFAFAGGADPYQIIDRMFATVKTDINSHWEAQFRLQADRSKTETGLVKTYQSATIQTLYRIAENVLLDAGVTFRGGEEETGGLGTDADYDNLIFQVGVAAEF